ncbi:MFS general substrate transporter [Penicillium longicatenatum]|uniref:MFS general substrate transporter n=1 Tax=Penicillium longicatenatum TaxID=1561947 RepID=UPI0025480DD8|nr:MFS general substrate transporter [Penicillium longicatenatum]KAJ5643392.1 MFS general substrate transporter [Penicillium longicatenatum]
MQVTMPDERTPLVKDAESQKSKPLGISKLLAGLVGVFLASADKSILLTTQTQIASSLHSPSNAALLLVSYNLGFCVALPVNELYIIFVLTSNSSGAVDTLWPFAFGRFVAGIGGAGMTDLLSVLVNEVFDVSEIAYVRSYIIAADIFGQGCGGPLGGVITDRVGWRWALLGQSPIGMLCLVLAYFQLPKIPKNHHKESKLSLWNFDYWGLGAFTISATTFVLGTTDGNSALDDNKPALFATSAIFLVLLIVIEKMSSRPIIPPSIIAAPSVRGIFLGQFLFFINVSTFMNNLPPYLAHIDHLTNTEIALRIWPTGLGLILGSMIAGKVLRTSARYRRESLIGVGICSISLIIMVIRWANGIKGFEIYYSFPWTVGGGILLSAQFVALAVRCPDQMANATAIYCLVQQVGQIVGTSASTTVLQQLFGLRLGVNLSDALPEKTQIIQKLLQNYGSITDLPQVLQNVVQSSYIEAFRLIPALSAILTITCGVLILFS